MNFPSSTNRVVPGHTPRPGSVNTLHPTFTARPTRTTLQPASAQSTLNRPHSKTSNNRLSLRPESRESRSSIGDRPMSAIDLTGVRGSLTRKTLYSITLLACS